MSDKHLHSEEGNTQLAHHSTVFPQDIRTYVPNWDNIITVLDLVNLLKSMGIISRFDHANPEELKEVEILLKKNLIIEVK